MSKQMKRKIYHGSSEIIKKPEFGYGKPYNDYGLGFYCTEQIDMARDWGVSKEKDGIANCYEIDCSGLEILNLNDEKYCILHWLSIEFTGYESAASKEWYRKKMLRDRSARREYFDVERNKRQKGDLYIIQIMDEEMRSDDLRLR